MIRLRNFAALFVIVFTLGIFPAHAASDDIPNNQLYRAVEGLKTSNVYIFPGGEVALNSELNAALKKSNVGVVVLPSSATLESYDALAKKDMKDSNYNFDSFAEEIRAGAQKYGYRTVVVLSAHKYSASSLHDNTDIAKRLSNSSASNPERIILNHSYIEDHNTIETHEWLPFLLWPIGVIVSVIAFVMGGALLIDAFQSLGSWRRRRAQDKNDRRAQEEKQRKLREQEEQRERENRQRVTADLSREIPKSLKQRLTDLQTWSLENIAPTDETFAASIKTMVERFGTLFERLRDRGTEQQRDLAMVSYNDMLDRITSALNDRYYLDIVRNGELWEDPEERIAQVKRAVEGASAQLLQNIRQVNASQDLDFKVALAALADLITATKVHDLYGESRARS